MVNAASYGVGVETAILAATLTPARQLGRDSESGSIDTGKLADFVVCDETLQREAVYLGGVKLS